MTIQTNPPLSQAEQIFKDLVWDPAVEAGQALLFSQVPFLGGPVIGTLSRSLISTISNWFFTQIKLFVDVSAIKLNNADHQAAFDKASLVLKVIAHDKGIDSNEFKAARENAKIALAKFTQLTR